MSMLGQLQVACQYSDGTKALLDNFSFARRAELEDSGVSVTCVMPGATETDFFERATRWTPKWVSKSSTARWLHRRGA